MITKNPNRTNKPAKTFQTTEFSHTTPARKVYRSIVNSTTRKGYRADLRAEAVARASAIRRSQRKTKDNPKPKLRGAKKKRQEALASAAGTA